MILADTSVWIDHFRAGDAALAAIVAQDKLVIHPAIIGELALGSLRQRASVLSFFAAQRQIAVASHDEVMTFIDLHALHGLGIGYVDVSLLASILLAPGASLYTRDRRLKLAAEKAGAALFNGSSVTN